MKNGGDSLDRIDRISFVGTGVADAGGTRRIMGQASTLGDGGAGMRGDSRRRYRKAEGVEGEFQPGSWGRVLRNLAGIRTKMEMDRAEFEALVRVQEEYLHRLTPETRFTAKLICEMHRDWLGWLYAWAGKAPQPPTLGESMRQGRSYLASGISDSGQHGEFGARNAAGAYALPAGTDSGGGAYDGRGAAELLLIHPFREGNGRLARWLAGLMSLQAGYPTPRYRFEGRGSRMERAQYLEAVKRGYLEEYEPLADFFAEGIRRRVAES